VHNLDLAPSDDFLFFHLEKFLARRRLRSGRQTEDVQEWLQGPAEVFFDEGIQKLVPYRGADKSLARPTSRCILFDGENISFDASLVIYINSTNIPPIMIINRIYENQNLLSL